MAWAASWFFSHDTKILPEKKT